MQILGSHSKSTEICVLASPPGDSDGCYNLRTTALRAASWAYFLLLPYKHPTIQLCGYMDIYLKICISYLHMFHIYVYIIYSISVSEPSSMLFVAPVLYFLLHHPYPVSKVQLKRHLLEKASPCLY